MSALFYKTDIFKLIEKTADKDVTELLMRSEHGPARTRRRSIKEYMTAAIGEKDGLTAQELFKRLLEGMGDYLREYPAPPYCRQSLWDACDAWAGRLAAELGLTYSPKLEEELDRPACADTGIALVKALHDENGKTKSDLAAELGVSEKTVQTDLRALDPGLKKRGRKAEVLRIGGQEMRVKIECGKDPESGKLLYHTEDRLHPLVLQLNTMQLGHLLTALGRADDDEGDIVCLDLAVDVWSQLSEKGRERIREIYGARERGLSAFLDDIEGESGERASMVFRTEDEMSAELSPKHNIEHAWKAGYTVKKMTVERGGEKTVLHGVRIKWNPADRDLFRAIPADEWPNEENSVSFHIDDVRGFPEFAD
ncbi:MAG: hypothetical protein J5827_04380 [Oscillospiraceae bacterium]|nr:hypothetical protein [Oscillospiraceae bacterium]